MLTLGGVTVIAVAIGWLAPAGSTQSRYDLRSRYSAPLDLSNQVTPLATVGQGLNDHSSTALFTVAFKGIPAGLTLDRVPIAILSSYDGSVWGINAPFALVGSDLPPGPTARVPSATVTQTYHLTAYPSAFLPALERPSKLLGVQLAFDRTTGMVVSSSGPGAPLTYRVVSNLPEFTPVEERRALPGIDPLLAPLVLPPPEGWPADMVEFAHRYGVGATPLDRLDALQTELRSRDFGYSTTARPDHTLGVLQSFLDPSASPANVDGRLGDSEQFASAFAVLARIEGIPSRVIVGYRVNSKEAAAGQQIRVKASDIAAWAEVNLNGVGWIPFDPTNTTPRNPAPSPSNAVKVAPTTVAGPTKGVSTINAPTHHPHGSAGWWLVALALTGGAVPVLIAGAKRIRKRRRRSRGTATDRILGAWLEARDQLQVRRLPVHRSTTLGEAARDCVEADRVDVADRIRAMQPLVDRALYAPETPSDDDAKAAWEIEGWIEAALVKQDAPLERIRAELDPRPLVSLRGPRH
jgi:transglutaminase-like putative cysteine protease